MLVPSPLHVFDMVTPVSWCWVIIDDNNMFCVWLRPLVSGFPVCLSVFGVIMSWKSLKIDYNRRSEYFCNILNKWILFMTLLGFMSSLFVCFFSSGVFEETCWSGKMHMKTWGRSSKTLHQGHWAQPSHGWWWLSSSGTGVKKYWQLLVCVWVWKCLSAVKWSWSSQKSCRESKLTFVVY